MSKPVYLSITVALMSVMLGSITFYILPHMHDGSPLTLGKCVAIMSPLVTVLWVVAVRPTNKGLNG